MRYWKEGAGMNQLWAGMIVIGIIYGAFNGKMPDITNAALDSANAAVTLCITMMEIATQAGIIEKVSEKMRPLIYFLFPRISAQHKANEYITVNFIANILGLGGGCDTGGTSGNGRTRVAGRG